ncbi:MAG: hypothetical protein HETSPECPRED_008362 [Heterodermia speciosa]|uniref:LYC1 C-terminal domain-containing protein n=1 Tax=Heterodermia speciosa TaxID=116794 RepID=A0A8H3FYI6_9LECA|nr:MAG: hypothetical protein HETSPECPRED_008362 [Heterodermia speciosa]
MHIQELPQVGIKSITEKDLDQLCRDDEAMIWRAMTSSSNTKTVMMLVPDLDHIVWHHRKEEFACDKLFGKHPHIKGVMTGEPNDRMWVIWTHRYYGHPHTISLTNTLYILRVVKEHQSKDHEQREHQVEQMRAILWAAQHEATEWKLDCVKMWDPAHIIQNVVERTGIRHRRVKRDEESIASLLWFGEGSGKEDMIEWLGNEKYGWR